MTDRHARLVALALVFAATFCVGIACRMAFGPGATPTSRAAGGLALAIDAAAVFMNALVYLMYCYNSLTDAAAVRGRIPGRGDTSSILAGIDGDAGGSPRERPAAVGTDAGLIDPHLPVDTCGC